MKSKPDKYEAADVSYLQLQDYKAMLATSQGCTYAQRGFELIANTMLT